MDLLTMAIEEHGGLRRWGEVSRFRAAASITGDVWKHKGQDGLLDDVVVLGEARDQRLTITPFPAPGRYAVWEPHHQVIKTDDGVPVADRFHPAASFVRRARHAKWDELRAASFAAQACWSRLTTPFLLARADFVTEEIGPWREDGQVWRRLAVICPGSIMAHDRQQTFSFDSSGLLCRVDYTVELLGGEQLVHYPSDYCECDGILVPMHHRVYARAADGTADLGATVLEMDFRDVGFS